MAAQQQSSKRISFMGQIRRYMPGSFWKSGQVAGVFIGLLLIWVLLKPGSHDLYLTGNMLAQPLSLITGMVISFCGKPRWWHRPGRSLRAAIHTASFWIPVVFLLVCLNHLLAQGIVAYITLTASMVLPKVSWADFFFLTAYPLTIIFFLLLPTHPPTILSRTRIILNTLIMMIAALIFSWYFILGPTLLQDTLALGARLVASVYPLGDLALLFCLLQLASRKVEASMRPGIFLLAFATLMLVFLDSAIDYQTLNGTYALGTWLDICMPMVYLCYGLAVHALRMAQAKQTSAPSAHSQTSTTVKQAPLVPSFWISFLPYALIPPVLGLTFYVAQQGRSGPLAWGVYAGSFILISLVLIRQITLLRVVTTYASMTAQLNEELRNVNSRLEALATSDPLTGLPNHRAVMDRIDAELSQCQAAQRNCAIIFADVDHFKRINDTWGHAAGDTVLREVGQRLHASVRQNDYVGRYGGEEFTILLTDIEQQEAYELAERLRHSLAEKPCTWQPEQEQPALPIAITASFGLATYPLDGITRKELVEMADAAMYVAKHSGRNRVCLTNEVNLRPSTTEGSAQVLRSTENDLAQLSSP